MTYHPRMGPDLILFDPCLNINIVEVKNFLDNLEMATEYKAADFLLSWILRGVCLMPSEPGYITHTGSQSHKLSSGHKQRSAGEEGPHPVIRRSSTASHQSLVL